VEVPIKRPTVEAACVGYFLANASSNDPPRGESKSTRLTN
jgi:hypothetical protein